MSKALNLRSEKIDLNLVAKLKNDLETMQKLQKMMQNLRSADYLYVPNIKTPEDDVEFVPICFKKGLSKQLKDQVFEIIESEIFNLAKKIMKEFGTDITMSIKQ